MMVWVFKIAKSVSSTLFKPLKLVQLHAIAYEILNTKNALKTRKPPKNPQVMSEVQSNIQHAMITLIVSVNNRVHSPGHAEK